MSVIIFDTTLRDGEQCPGATMSVREKLSVADLLDNMGVDVIEAGFSAASEGDFQCVAAIAKEVKNATVCSLARGIKKDIELAAKSLEHAKKPRIHTFISTSDIHITQQFKMTHEQVLEVIDSTVRFAKSFYDDVEWSAMDATRSNMDYLIKAVEVAIKAGATTINLPDTVGYSTPDEYKNMMLLIHNKFPNVILSAHCHNDLGLATANALAGIEGGARQIECTVNGIGERAGNSALEEIVMALKTRNDFFKQSTNIDSTKIYNISRFVSGVTGFSIQKNKAIVGANAFAHESGIHQDGMVKNRNTYEIITPETVGVPKSTLVLGKHSGRAAIKNKLLELGVVLTEDELNRLFTDFKALCDKKKHITEDDFIALICEQHDSFTANFINLISLNTSHIDANKYRADVTLRFKDEDIKLNAEGNGPLDAIFCAINKITDGDIKLVRFEVHSISDGTDAQAESNIMLSKNGKETTGHARDTDTIYASTKAYISAMNKIISTGGKNAKNLI